MKKVNIEDGKKILLSMLHGDVTFVTLLHALTELDRDDFDKPYNGCFYAVINEGDINIILKRLYGDDKKEKYVIGIVVHIINASNDYKTKYKPTNDKTGAVFTCLSGVYGEAVDKDGEYTFAFLLNEMYLSLTGQETILVSFHSGEHKEVLNKASSGNTEDLYALVDFKTGKPRLVIPVPIEEQ
jgi:hypothetical protein